jgi:hypothetical protein
LVAAQVLEGEVQAGAVPTPLKATFLIGYDDVDVLLKPCLLLPAPKPLWQVAHVAVVSAA